MTTLLYLDDTYLFEGSATVRDVTEYEGRTAILLDRTIFYPQGGGQPADHGDIESAVSEFTVDDVRLSPEGVVYHFGTFKNGTLKPGDAVDLKIDKERRRLNARLHSAGHMIDLAIMEYAEALLKPVKGYHFPEGAYVEYSGVVEDKELFKVYLEGRLAELIAQKLKKKVDILTAAEADEQGIAAPPGKNVRAIGFGEYPACGCGGTHVNNSADIGEITIRKIQNKKGNLRIAYSLNS